MEGSSGPTAWQNALKPPPVPVVSTIGVSNAVAAPNCSATVVENGATVDPPVAVAVPSLSPQPDGVVEVVTVTVAVPTVATAVPVQPEPISVAVTK